MAGPLPSACSSPLACMGCHPPHAEPPVDPCVSREGEAWLARPDVQAALHANASGQLDWAYKGCTEGELFEVGAALLCHVLSTAHPAGLQGVHAGGWVLFQLGAGGGCRCKAWGIVMRVGLALIRAAALKGGSSSWVLPARRCANAACLVPACGARRVRLGCAGVAPPSPSLPPWIPPPFHNKAVQCRRPAGQPAAAVPPPV